MRIVKNALKWMFLRENQRFSINLNAFFEIFKIDNFLKKLTNTSKIDVKN